MFSCCSISLAGNRDQLLHRMRLDTQMVKGLVSETPPANKAGYVAIAKVLEEAAEKEGGALSEILDEFKQKSKEVPKFVDVKVRSI